MSMSSITSFPSIVVSRPRETEYHPLQESALADYIEGLTVASNEQTSKIRSVVRKALEVSSLAIVAGSRVGMVMICMTGAAVVFDRPADDPLTLAMGISNAAGVVITFGSMSAFTMIKVIQEITRKNTPQEKALILNDFPLILKSVFKVVAIVAGLSAQVPLAYATYRSSVFAPAVFGVIQLLDCGRASYSIDQSLSAVFKKGIPKYEGLEQRIIDSRDILSREIQNFRRFLADESSDPKAILATQNSFRSSASQRLDEEAGLLNQAGAIPVNDFISMITDSNNPRIDAPPPMPKGVGYALDSLALVITATVLAKFWQLGGDAANLFTEGKPELEREICYYISASVVTLANAHLWFSLIRKSTHLMANVLRCAVPNTVTEKLHGRVHKLLTGVGGLASVFSFVPQFYFAKLAFPGWPYLPVGFISTLGAIFGGAAATFSLRDILIGKFTRNEESQQILALDNNLLKLAETIQKVPPKEFAKFLTTLRPELKQRLQSPSDTELTLYLSSKED